MSKIEEMLDEFKEVIKEGDKIFKREDSKLERALQDFAFECYHCSKFNQASVEDMKTYVLHKKMCENCNHKKKLKQSLKQIILEELGTLCMVDRDDYNSGIVDCKRTVGELFNGIINENREINGGETNEPKIRT